MRPASPGIDILPGLGCVSVEIGSPCRVVVRNTRAEDRPIVWFAQWRTVDGYILKSDTVRVRELIVPANGTAEIVAPPPSPEARQFELWAGDRP